MQEKKRILLKLTGEIFLDQEKTNLSSFFIEKIIKQIKILSGTHQFGIVMGGGNFFRGEHQSRLLNINPATGHYVGMVATMMNGLIIKDLLDQQAIASTVFSALDCPAVGTPINQAGINQALKQDHVLIFTGGSGNPFFTTDTTALLRGLQINAEEIWKGTNVDGIYTDDPEQYPDAQLIKSLSYEQALVQKIGIMDATAYTLAQTYKQTIRVFNIFGKEALVRAVQDITFGSTIE